MNSYLFSLCFVLAFTVFVCANPVTYKVDYVLTDDSLYPNGEIPGTVYYKFDPDAPQTSKVRYEHSFFVGEQITKVTELEDYGAGRVFKICGDTCESYPLSRAAQQWWYKPGDSKQAGDMIDVYQHYTRYATDYGVTDLWLKDEEVPTNKFYLKKLGFSSGRELTFVDSTFALVDPASEKFDPNAGGIHCSSESCRTYMDLIFVLDSSGSVGKSNWAKMVDFVKNVVNMTDISPQSAAVAVIGFGGNCTDKGTCLGEKDKVRVSWEKFQGYPQSQFKVMDSGSTFNATKDGQFVLRCGWRTEGGKRVYYPRGNATLCENARNKKEGYSWTKCTGKTYMVINAEDVIVDATDSITRCWGNYENVTQYQMDHPKEPIFISGVHVPLTYKPKAELIQDIQQKAVWIHGDTCQALGYIKAIEIFNRNERAAENNGLVPQRVVIGITDGEDHCAEMTKQYAEVLKRNYNVTLIEVSIALKTVYDKWLLQSLASKFAGMPAYFDVSNFEGLHELIDKMVTAVCQTDYSESTGKCDMKCNGFCGCGGECLCPNCRSSLSNKCHTYSCSVAGGVTAGCIDSPVNCDDGKHCTDEVCVNDTGCVTTERDCVKDLKTCQLSKCSEELEGECDEAKNYDSLCQAYQWPCYKAICDPDNDESDNVTGCRYEYSCVGELPAIYNEHGEYESGCYEYVCENLTGQCGSINVCDRMSRNNLCTNFKCDKSAGKCVPSGDKVTCPDINDCRPESKCNPSTGQCDVVEVTPADCRQTFVEEAKKHTGDGGWFAVESDIEPYYRCGEPKCEAYAEGASSVVSKKQIHHCVFTPREDNTCDVCNGQLSTQVSFEQCENRALELHEENPEVCFISTCVKTGESSSECAFTNITCPHIPCMNVTCNQNTLKCEYLWTEDWLNKTNYINSCNDLQCIDDVPTLVDMSLSRCVGTNNVSVPVCEVYDRCDEHVGCIYKAKCVRSNNCTTMTCNEETNQCVEEAVKCKDANNTCYKFECNNKTDNCEAVHIPVEQACGTTDLCHALVCSVTANKCILEALPYPNETDLCHNYTCDPETGMWSVVDKCDDNNICTDDTCVLYDGTCRNFKRDCHELNMTGLGSCFSRACSKSRKNGCFRKVYENSFFDECGNCFRGYSGSDSGLTDSEVSNCKKALSFPEEAAIISAGVLTAIIIACVIGALAVSTATTLATKELIRRAREANSRGANENPLYEDDGQEMANPTFVGSS